MGRGMLTDEIKTLSQKFLGYEMDTTELRLLPFLDYTIKNGGKFNVNRSSFEEISVLNSYFIKKYLSLPEDVLYVTKEFYDFMQEVLWLSYVERE